MQDKVKSSQGKHLLLLFIILLVLLGALNNEQRTAYGQPPRPIPGKWYLSIEVTDQLEQKVAGQSVVVKNSQGVVVYTGYTDNDGKARIQLTQGKYTVFIQDQQIAVNLKEDTDVYVTVTVDLPKGFGGGDILNTCKIVCTEYES